MISINNLTYSIGSFELKVSLDIKDNEYFVLLGMTGSGKTIFLENICGLRQRVQGKVLLDYVDVTTANPWQRHIGYVPQDGALFPHMNVAKNIGFSLSLKNSRRSQAGEKISALARMLHIEHLVQRKVIGLSGGERQRVALARALIMRPKVLILDEPVSALDEHTREVVLRELKKLQRSLKLSVIHVCHSFEEAQLVGDRIGIMDNGSIIQTGTVKKLLNKPKNRYVARILRHVNIFEGEAEASGEFIRFGNKGCKLKGPSVKAGKVSFLVRPWMIELAPASFQRFVIRPDNRLSGEITEIISTGAFEKIQFSGHLDLVFYLSCQEIEKNGLRQGSKIDLVFPRNAIHIMGGA